LYGIFGAGKRMFDYLGDEHIELELAAATGSAAAATDLRLRVLQ
jgi:hypothetical protein